jgi:hypothetical protein
MTTQTDIGIRTLTITDEDAALIIDALRVKAANRRRSAPEPSYVGSSRSLAYCTAMGEAVRCDKLAAALESQPD